MKLSWYIFEESYLLSLNYIQLECKLTLDIEARISIEHPNANKIKLFEDNFELIRLELSGVRFYESITNPQVMNDPNEDIGNIDRLHLLENVEIIDSTDKELYGLTFIEMISEYINLKVGFENLIIKK